MGGANRALAFADVRDVVRRSKHLCPPARFHSPGRFRARAVNGGRGIVAPAPAGRTNRIARSADVHFTSAANRPRRLAHDRTKHAFPVSLSTWGLAIFAPLLVLSPYHPARSEVGSDAI